MTKFVTHKELEERDEFLKAMIKSVPVHRMSEATVMQIANIKERVASVEATVKDKVGFKHFYWVVGIMMTLLMTTIGYLIDQIHDLQEAQYEVAREVSSISGSLESIEFIN